MGDVLNAGEVEARVRGSLDRLGIQYEELACDPDFADTAAFCERYEIAPADSVNTILVASRRGPQRYAACLLLATTRLDVNKVVRRKMGVPKASFASDDEAREVTGMLPGGVTPFGLAEGLPLLVDDAVRGERTVWLGGGSRALKIGVAADALRQLPGSEIVEGLAANR